jgi:hypothetical protein
MHPIDRGVLSVLRNLVQRIPRNWIVWIVVDLAASDDRHPLIKQTHQGANHPGFGLATLAKEHHVVAGDESILKLRHNCVLVAKNTCEQGFTSSNPDNRISTDFLFNWP